MQVGLIFFFKHKLCLGALNWSDQKLLGLTRPTDPDSLKPIIYSGLKVCLLGPAVGYLGCVQIISKYFFDIWPSIHPTSAHSSPLDLWFPEVASIVGCCFQKGSFKLTISQGTMISNELHKNKTKIASDRLDPFDYNKTSIYH